MHYYRSILLTVTITLVQLPVFAEAEAEIELLLQPSLPSTLASQSIIMAITDMNKSTLAVGERGHILSWQDKNHWQQHKVPVSVALTSVTVLSDGSKIAVGQDAVILTSAAGSDEWHTVFTGYDLMKQKSQLLTLEINQLETTIKNTSDNDQLEEFENRLEELNFSLEDIQTEQHTGPNKPLLSVTRTKQDIVFATGAYGTLLISADKGNSWQLIDDKLDNPDTYHLNAITATEDDQLYIVGENGLGFRSNDQGNSWSTMSLPYSGSLFGIIAGRNPSYLVAFGLQGNFVVSTDAGISWQHKNIGSSASFLAGTFSGDDQVYLVGHGGLVVDFNVHKPDQIQIRKHPSGAALSAITIKNNMLVLAGQFGITTWQIK